MQCPAEQVKRVARVHHGSTAACCAEASPCCVLGISSGLPLCQPLCLGCATARLHASPTLVCMLLLTRLHAAAPAAASCRDGSSRQTKLQPFWTLRRQSLRLAAQARPPLRLATTSSPDATAAGVHLSVQFRPFHMKCQQAFFVASLYGHSPALSPAVLQAPSLPPPQ